ncbi:MAG TPA: hypothetical protein VNJ70_05550 [Thermoanaerobaculia bacterium]|nr:hypothetical protein [Thermoanaerobaculia bacterium]
MPRHKMPDIIVLLPGVTGSVLKKDGAVLWGFSAGSIASSLLSGAHNLKQALALAEDPTDEDDLGDGIVAAALIPDLHLLPGLWKIDGYTKVAETLMGRFDLEEGKNFFPFPYDWRRDNRVAARRLRKESRKWLEGWRTSANSQAKLILVCHSMGGIVARYFLEALGGWKDTRALVTFGTPYRGSLNALDTLANGLRKGPFGLLDLSEMTRTFTAIYQLLPIFKCYDPGNGKLVRVGETSGIPNVDAEKAKAALAFHREIENAVEANQQDPAYQREGYRVYPIVGIAQQTSQSARRAGDGVIMAPSYEGTDHGGDGTVPRVSATPLEHSAGGEMFASTQHAALQNSAPVLTHLTGLINSLYLDLGSFRKARLSPVKVALEVEDIYWSAEPITIRARPEREGVKLAATVTNSGTGSTVGTLPLREDEDGWCVADFAPPGAGTYSVQVFGDEGVERAADAFAIADLGSYSS